MTAMTDARTTLRRRAVRTLRDRARTSDHREIYDRLIDVIGEHRPWWDWGHRLMALTGRDDCGNWSPPRVRDLYLRRDVPGVHTTRSGTTAWDGVMKRDEEWFAFDSQDDGHTIRIGWLGRDGRLVDTGITGRAEIALFRRWFVWDGWVKAEWFGLRRWLYYRGLHNAVDHRMPFTCGVTPPKGSGGYTNWHCDVRRPTTAILTGRRQQHEGPHRFVNYTWAGGASRVEYWPVEARVRRG